MTLPESTDGLRDIVIEITARVLHQTLVPGPVAGAKSFHQIGADSVTVYQIHLEIEKHFELILEDTFLYENDTPEQVASALAVLMAGPPPP